MFSVYDGQRLIWKAGIGEYRTEKETFSRVTYSGSQNNPSSFTVATKAGLTYTYLPVLDSSDTRVWAVDKIVDSTNNKITFLYTESTENDEYTIDEIRYAYQTTNLFNAYVKFVYDENRGDQFSGWIAGQPVAINSRLTHVKTYSDGNLARDYRFKYAADAESGSSYIAALKLCNGDDECYRETQFDWSNTNAGIGSRISTKLLRRWF